LALRDFAFEYDDGESGTRIAATNVNADLGRHTEGDFDGIRGPFAVGGGVDMLFGGRALRIEPIDTTLGFDGRNVWLQDLPLRTPLLEASVTGRIDRVLDAPALDLAFDGRANLLEATTWAAAPITASGTPAVSGNITGPVAEVAATVRFDGSGLTVGGESGVTATGELSVDASRLEGHRGHLLSASGGQADATFVVTCDECPLTAQATCQGLDVRAGLRVASQPLQPVGARLDGELDFVSGPTRTARLRVDAAGLNGAGLTPVDGRATAEVTGDRWTATHDLRVPGITSNGTTSGRIDPDDTTRTTI